MEKQLQQQTRYYTHPSRQQPPQQPHPNGRAPLYHANGTSTTHQKTFYGQLHSNGTGALNDAARVIVASSQKRGATVAPSSFVTSADPFTCTCHLFQKGPSAQSAPPRHPPTSATLPWSSSESTLQGTAEVVRQQRLMHRAHHHHHLLHHKRLPAVPGSKAVDDAHFSRQQQWMLHQQCLERLSSASDSQLDCTGACCCEWLGKALLCSCQLPSSSDEASSPSHNKERPSAAQNMPKMS